MCIFPKPPKTEQRPILNPDTTKQKADEAKRRVGASNFAATISPDTLLGGAAKGGSTTTSPKTLFGGG